MNIGDYLVKNQEGTYMVCKFDSSKNDYFDIGKVYTPRGLYNFIRNEKWADFEFQRVTPNLDDLVYRARLPLRREATKIG